MTLLFESKLELTVRTAVINLCGLGGDSGAGCKKNAVPKGQQPFL